MQELAPEFSLTTSFPTLNALNNLKLAIVEVFRNLRQSFFFVRELPTHYYIPEINNYICLPKPLSM